MFDVLKFGAKTDGVTESTNAIRDAISAAVEKGGGIIHFPKGNYTTGAIHLKSNITLNIDSEAIIKFSNDFDDYLPMVLVHWEGTEVINFSPLIYANGVENIGITGRGIIDGNGEKWWDFYRNLKENAKKTGHWDTSSKWQKLFLQSNAKLLANTSELPDEDTQLKQGFLRAHFIQLINSKNILIQGLTIRNSPFWTVNPVLSDNITITGLTIENPSNSPNTDGIDPDSCRNVSISNSSISVGDDCVCIKSGKDRQARRINRPSENIMITNCKMFRGHGGVVIGSEMSGSVRNINASNLYFEGTDRGVRIKSTRGRGGVVENVYMSNIVMKNIKYEGITVNTFYTKTNPEPVSERTPIFKNFILKNITGDAKFGIQLLGSPEMPLKNISLNDIDITAKQDIVINDAEDIFFKNVSTKTLT